VRIALTWFEELDKHEIVQRIKTCPDYTCTMPDHVVLTIITALQAYQPWVSVEERLPAREDADKKGLVLTYDKLEKQETFPWDCIEEWNATKDNKITHWKPLPAPPKGE